MSLSMRAGASAVGALAVAAALLPSLTSAQDPAAREITTRNKVKAVEFVHAGAVRGEKLAMGDRVITRQTLFDADDRRIGTLATDCVNTGPTAEFFAARLQCVSSYRFEDGQIVSAGAVRLADGAATRFPIVGGAGAYRGARGEVAPGAPVPGYESVDVLRLED